VRRYAPASLRCAVDDSHAAGAKLLFDAVMSEDPADHTRPPFLGLGCGRFPANWSLTDDARTAQPPAMSDVTGGMRVACASPYSCQAVCPYTPRRREAGTRWAVPSS
jgi:hypothetical protein